MLLVGLLGFVLGSCMRSTLEPSSDASFTGSAEERPGPPAPLSLIPLPSPSRVGSNAGSGAM